MTAPNGLIIAAPASGSGKTVITLGLLRALRNANVPVVGAKAGPDYIDPVFHSAASGQPAFNLDPWAMRPKTLDQLLTSLPGEPGTLIVEGVMGLFDGVHLPDRPDTGSTADLAARTGWPVVLVVDTARQAASVGALIRGFAGHRSDVQVAGVIFNQVANKNHAAVLRASTQAAAPEVRILGAIIRNPALGVPERHLGLVQAGELDELETFIEAAARAVANQVDIDVLLSLAKPCGLPASSGRHFAMSLPPLAHRIAVAQDRAFAFCYPAILEGWRAAGAEIVLFSPLANEAPDMAAGAIYLPGGYPELHAETLASANIFLGGLHEAAAQEKIIFGECGGYMVLGRGIISADGERHAMADLLPVETSFAKRCLHLGYRDVRLCADGPLGTVGERYRGHEFHYASVVEEQTESPLFAAANARGESLGLVGAVAGSVSGSFIHLIDRVDA